MSGSPTWTSTIAKDYLAQGASDTQTSLWSKKRCIQYKNGSHIGRDWMRIEQFMGCVVAGDAAWQALTADPNSPSTPKDVRSSQIASTERFEHSRTTDSPEPAVRGKARGKEV